MIYIQLFSTDCDLLCGEYRARSAFTFMQSDLALHSPAQPGWLSGKCVGLMSWWLGVRDPIDAKFLSGVFSPFTSAEACEKSSRWFWKEICVSTGMKKPGNTFTSPTAMI